MNQQRPTRGFSMLIVLVLLAAAFAAVAAVSSLAVEQKYATASVGREPMARAIAETCADRAAALAELMSPDGDFDAVLDPPGPRQFVPRTGVTVQVPASSSDSFHTWALLTKDDGYSGWCDDVGCGACLFRYDDNSDDGVSRSTGSTSVDANGVSEGKADADVFTRDRDRAITAVGIYPVKDIADINDAARTRVTIRRFVANEPAQASPAVWVGERFTTDNGKICGSGGVTADAMDLRNSGRAPRRRARRLTAAPSRAMRRSPAAPKPPSRTRSSRRLRRPHRRDGSMGAGSPTPTSPPATLAQTTPGVSTSASQQRRTRTQRLAAPMQHQATATRPRRERGRRLRLRLHRDHAALAARAVCAQQRPRASLPCQL